MTATDLYLDLLARALTRALYEDNDQIVGLINHRGTGSLKHRFALRVAPILAKANLELVQKRPYSAEARENGRDWPARAESMAGLKRMANTRECIETILRDNVPGDLIETGVWRGGMCIFMRGVLAAYEVTDRIVWLADSFEGLPATDARKFEVDVKDDYDFDFLAVGLDQVRKNFERYAFLDDQVRFLKGWFKDTLPTAPVERLALLRLDGDMYESTIQALDSLYPKLSVGGFCIVDDYGAIDACQQAVTEYRTKHGVRDPIIDIDGWAVYWRKS